MKDTAQCPRAIADVRGRHAGEGHGEYRVKGTKRPAGRHNGRLRCMCFPATAVPSNTIRSSGGAAKDWRSSHATRSLDHSATKE